MSQSTDELLITMADITRAGYCPSGARRWFSAYKLDAEFRALIKGGSMTAAQLLSTKDALAMRVVEAKVQREWLDGDPSALIITVDDLRESKQCMAGAREFTARHGINWQGFLERGISAKELIAIGDHEGLRVLRKKLERGHG